MLHSRPAAHRYKGPLSILPGADDCIPFSWKGKQATCKTPIPGIKLTCVTAAMEPRAKAARQQNPNTFPCCFRLKVPYCLTARPRVAQLCSQSLPRFSEGECLSRDKERKIHSQHKMASYQLFWEARAEKPWCYMLHDVVVGMPLLTPHKRKNSSSISFSALTQRSLFQSPMR